MRRDESSNEELIEDNAKGVGKSSPNSTSKRSSAHKQETGNRKQETTWRRTAATTWVNRGDRPPQRPQNTELSKKTPRCADRRLPARGSSKSSVHARISEKVFQSAGCDDNTAQKIEQENTVREKNSRKNSRKTAEKQQKTVKKVQCTTMKTKENKIKTKEKRKKRKKKKETTKHCMRQCPGQRSESPNPTNSSQQHKPPLEARTEKTNTRLRFRHASISPCFSVCLFCRACRKTAEEEYFWLDSLTMAACVCDPHAYFFISADYPRNTH